MYPIKSFDELSRFCRTNQEVFKGEVKRLVLLFQGLNRFEYYDQVTSDIEFLLAEKSSLLVIPYLAPWSWMNVSSVMYTNWLVEEIFRLFELPQDTKIVSTGFSMGGLAALIYPIFSDRSIAGVMANSPVCNLVEHFQERRDVPRTLINAFISYPDGLEEGIRSRSPIHQIEAMKKIPYFIVAGGADDQVSKARHADQLVKLMREKNFDITYHEIPTMRHWRVNDYDVWKDMLNFITER